MAKSLNTLAKQLRRNHGFLLVTSFDAGIVPGTILNARRWNDISRIGHLDDGLDAAALPAVDGPAVCMLADFNRSHEMGVDAALQLIRPRGDVSTRFRRAKEVVARFDSPMIRQMSLFDIEDAVRANDSIWDKAIGRALVERRTRLVYAVVSGRLSFMFRGTGEFGIDIRTDVGNLHDVGLEPEWKWRNEATLESKKELTIAVETARYVERRQAFRPMAAKV
jgi:hypothetical protein